MTPTPSQSAGTVLLIEDNEAVVDSIQRALGAADYKVVLANSAKTAFASIFKSPPDIIILDINLPDLDGFHVAQELKKNMMLRHIPVIVLSSRIDFLEKMRSLDVVVDEYIVKPIDPQDLLLRTRLVLQRAQVNLDANPLTKLPGNTAIVKTIKGKLAAGRPYAVGYADLNNFKSYNDKYGFSNGDKVIHYAAQVIVGIVARLSPQDNFVGHIGGDDFIFVCSYDKATEISQAIVTEFDKGIPRFYPEEDRKRGTITVEDRRGVVSEFPLVSVAIGLVTDEGKKFTNLGQINHSLTQLKKYAKSFQGSSFVKDRRGPDAKLGELSGSPASADTQRVLDNIAAAIGTFLPSQLKQVIDAGNVTILFQPILDMRTDDVIGHEGLVRGPAGTPLEYPDALFKMARTNKCVKELDLLCIKKVLEVSRELHKGLKLFLNIFPETLTDENALYRLVDSDPNSRNADLVFELSGSHRDNDSADMYFRLKHLKQHGYKVCLDATQALSDRGVKYMAELRPDYIKLDMLGYQNMVNDYKKQDEFLRTVKIIRQIGAEIISTKLESRADSFLALKADISLGQGFLFALPSQPTRNAVS